MEDSEHPLDDLDPTNRVLKRAQYEAFVFSYFDGDVIVRNESHTEPENHKYRITVNDGHPVACTCPADEHYDGPCKHRVAVAIRRPILDIVADAQLAADGGVPQSPGSPETDDEAGCECEHLPNGLPCWECVRTGCRDLPDDANNERP